MPLSERARIEVFLPDVRHPVYPELRDTLETEFTHAFGGCSLGSDLRGSYLSRAGAVVHDRVNVLFTDTPFTFTSNRETLALYVDKLRSAVMDALQEEEILIAVYPVFHGE